MASELAGLDVGGMASTAASGLYTGTMWSIFIIFLAVIIGGLVYYLLFNIKVRLRVRTSTYDYIIDDKGRLAKDKDGIECLRLLRYKIKNLPSPPPEAISLTKKGHRVLEIEIDESGGARFIIKNKLTRQFEPFNTNDREFYVNEVRKAQLKKKLTLSELILQLAPLTAIVIIFVLALIYWGDVMQPAIQFGESNKDIAATQAETVAMLKEIIKKEQVIRDEEAEGVSDEKLNAPPPAESEEEVIS